MAGFQTSRTQSGASTTGKIFNYDVAAGHSTRIAPGDVMKTTGTATAGTGVPLIDVTQSATGQITGVCTAVDITYAGEALSDTGLPAAVGGSVKVQVDPDMLYEVDVTGGTLVVANVGLNANIDDTAASLSGGLTVSNMAITVTGVATTVTFPFRIVALLKDDAGVLGNRALVRINSSNLAAGTVGV